MTKSSIRGATVRLQLFYARQRPEFLGQVFRDSFSVFYVIDERRFRAQQRGFHVEKSALVTTPSRLQLGDPLGRLRSHGGDDIGRVSAGIYFVL